MPGRLVDVGGYRMHLYCVGDADPTVVLDSGLGDSFCGMEEGTERDQYIRKSVLV
jgi:hypothetical protein